MKFIRKRLTYSNVMSSLAVFLILGGATAFAAQLAKKSVGVNQLKANAVTTAKIKKGAVNFAKLASGIEVIGTASGGPVAANGGTVDIPLTGTTTFTPQAGVVNFLSVEVRGNSLARTGVPTCVPDVVPYVNGNEFEVAQGFLSVRAVAPSADEPTGLRPVTSETGPLGLTSPGVAQTITAKVLGDTDCTASSTVSVAIALTRAK